MKFEKLKAIADLKDQFEILSRRNTGTMEEAERILQVRRDRLHSLIRDDFTFFFTSCEFNVTDDDELLRAAYKSITVTLKLQKPGRRTDDVNCLLRYLMTVSADHEEMHTIFVRARNGGDTSGSRPRRSEAEKSVMETLTEEAVALARLRTEIREASGLLTHESQKTIMTDLAHRTAILQQNILERRQELETGSYIISVIPAEDEWDRENSRSFETLADFLKHMDKEPPPELVDHPDPAGEHLMDSEPFIG